MQCCFFFFFNDTATTEIYTLSLHDALPISGDPESVERPPPNVSMSASPIRMRHRGARRFWLRNCADPPVSDFVVMITRRSESTRLNSSHANISYAVFCLKKKKR